MYAVIATGGKQYRVAEGETLRCEKLAGEPGAKITFDQVLLVGGGEGAPTVGKPVVAGAVVEGEVVLQDLDKKILVFKKKRRKGYQKRFGHRQPFTDVKITKISA